MKPTECAANSKAANNLTWKVAEMDITVAVSSYELYGMLRALVEFMVLYFDSYSIVLVMSTSRFVDVFRPTNEEPEIHQKELQRRLQTAHISINT